MFGVGFGDWLTNKRIHRVKGQSDSRSELSVDSEGSSHNPAGRRQLSVLSLIDPQCQSKITVTQCVATEGFRRSHKHITSHVRDISHYSQAPR